MDKKIVKRIFIYIIIIVIVFGTKHILYRNAHDLTKEVRDRAKNYSVSEDFKNLNGIIYALQDINSSKIVNNRFVATPYRFTNFIKLHTILFAVKNLDLDSNIIVGDEISLAHNDNIGLKKGEYKVRDIVKASIITLADDACYALSKASVDKIIGKRLSVNEFQNVFRDEIKKIMPEDVIINEPDAYGIDNKTTAYHVVNDLKGILLNVDSEYDIYQIDNYKKEFLKEILKIKDDKIQDSNGNTYYLKAKNDFKCPNDSNIEWIKTDVSDGKYNSIIMYKNKNLEYLLFVSANTEDESYNICNDFIKLYQKW